LTIIEIRPFRNGWQVFEAPGVQPVFLTKKGDELRAQSREFSLRLDSTAKLEKAISFDEVQRKL
jgi:hypothetical protein